LLPGSKAQILFGHRFVSKLWQIVYTGIQESARHMISRTAYHPGTVT